MASTTQDFGPNDNPQTSNPSATGATGSTSSNDPVVATYGNTHSSTNRTNPIDPSDPQSTANPAYGNSTFSSPYETGGGNTGQGDGEGAGVGGSGQGAGVGQPLHAGAQGALGDDYHANIDAAYGHATGREPPTVSHANVGEKRSPYFTAGGNPGQAGGEGGTKLSDIEPSAPSTANMTGAEVVPDTGYRAQPYTSGNQAATSTSETDDGMENKSSGSKIKDMAQGVKGLFAEGHRAGESTGGTSNGTMDQKFNEVLGPYPHTAPFPSLRPLREFAEDGDGEFPSSVYDVKPKKGRILRVLRT